MKWCEIELLINSDVLTEYIDSPYQLQKLNEKVYEFLLGNTYYISAEYSLINAMFKKLIEANRWDGRIALSYYEYLLYEGWEYECIILRTLLLNQNLKGAAEFCLDTKLVDSNGISYFRDDAIWRGIDYDDGSLPASLEKWNIEYDCSSNTFYGEKYETK